MSSKPTEPTTYIVADTYFTRGKNDTGWYATVKEYKTGRRNWAGPFTTQTQAAVYFMLSKAEDGEEIGNRVRFFSRDEVIEARSKKDGNSFNRPRDSVLRFTPDEVTQDVIDLYTAAVATPDDMTSVLTADADTAPETPEATEAETPEDAGETAVTGASGPASGTAVQKTGNPVTTVVMREGIGYMTEAGAMRDWYTDGDGDEDVTAGPGEDTPENGESPSEVHARLTADDEGWGSAMHHLTAERAGE